MGEATYFLFDYELLYRVYLLVKIKSFITFAKKIAIYGILERGGSDREDEWACAGRQAICVCYQLR